MYVDGNSTSPVMREHIQTSDTADPPCCRFPASLYSWSDVIRYRLIPRRRLMSRVFSGLIM